MKNKYQGLPFYFFFQMKQKNQLKTMIIARYKLKPALMSDIKCGMSDSFSSSLVAGLKTVKGVPCCFNTFCTEVKLIKHIFLLALAFR